jgi:glyoxylase-like metal-dependent hydrolase (beta-lactamase superfamily II)
MTAPVFANSATVAAPERFMLRGGSWRMRQLAVRYGLYLGAPVGPVLIDTGYTAHSVNAAGRSLGLRAYGRLLRPELQAEGQPEPFLARFGLRPGDIRCVIVTHFHVDHVSGLRLFDRARFLASGSGWRSFSTASALANLRHGMFAELLPPDFADRLDLIETLPRVPAAPLAAKGHDLFGDGRMIALPLPGHAAGHFGLVFPQLARPLLYGVDAQWLLAALPEGERPGFPARLVAAEPLETGPTCDLLEAFAQAGGDVMLCHDPDPAPYDLRPEDRP